MTDYNNIYVDLGGYDASAELDNHGSPICSDGNSYATGTEQNPLSLSQFVSYIRYRLSTSSDKHRKFYLKGSGEYTKDFGSFSHYAGVLFFNNSDVGVMIIDVVSWEENTPYKMKLNQKTSISGVAFPLKNDGLGSIGDEIHSTMYIILNRVYLRISNMQFETGTCSDSTYTDIPVGALMFGALSGNNVSALDNKIMLSNCLFITNGTGDSGDTDLLPLAFKICCIGNYIELYNNIFYSRNYGVNSSVPSVDGSVFAIKDMPSEQSTLMFAKYAIQNNMFFNIGEMLRIVNNNDFLGTIPVRIQYNIFSTSSDTLTNSTPSEDYINLFSYEDAWNFNVFDYPVVSVLSGGILSLTLDDLEYTSQHWIGTSACYGVRGIVDDTPVYYTHPNSLTDVFGVRDGIGPLYFPELPDYRIDCTPRYPNINDFVDIYNRDTAYDANNIFNEYEWSVGGDEYFSTSGSISVQATNIGIYNVSSYITSFNRWYDISSLNDTEFMVLIPGHISIDTYTSPTDTTPTNEFAIGDQIYLRISNLFESTPSISSMIITWDDPYSHDSSVRISDIENYGDVVNIPHIYNKIGNVDINVSGTKIDGISFSENVSIDITDDINRSEYYVDFDAIYENDKDIQLSYGIPDDFETGHINGLWDADFFNTYNVVTLWNDDPEDMMVAVGTNKSIIMKGIKWGKFNTEFSFVRKNILCTPRMYLNIDANESYVEWDYIQDSLIIYNAITGKYIKRKYDAVGNKDLTCGDSLRRLWVKIEFEPVTTDNVDATTMIVYGKTQRENDWTELYTFSFGMFNSMNVKVEGTYDCGFGEILMEADFVDETVSGMTSNGSEELPFTYTEFVGRISYDGDGDFRDIYHCRGYREATDNIIINKNNFYEIDAWNSMVYGPWVINFRIADNKNVYLDGCIISDGILYNKPSSSTGSLFVTNMYNMFVTWNNSGKIVFNRTIWIDDEIKTTNIIGCTINSNNGFKTQWDAV